LQNKVMEIKVNAYAKLNLSLDVLSKMKNGYHAMRMVMQCVDICDDIHIVQRDKPGILVRTNVPYLPCDGRNIAYQAAQQFLNAANLHSVGLTIDIFKRIPVCAGMGGGSADAAAVLRGLNQMFHCVFGSNDLQVLGKTLGADVPYCVCGGTMLAEGIGDVLTELTPIPHTYIVVCKPSFSVSTPTLFAKLDQIRVKYHPDTNGIIVALNQGNVKDIAHRLYNVFECALPSSAQQTIAEIKMKLIDNGALGAVMTGTGSAVFGLYDSKHTAQQAYSVLKKQYNDCYLTETIGKIPV
jgi:4-diphosphocytidyl-2-C-methyl-D-erythritol kinase